MDTQNKTIEHIPSEHIKKLNAHVLTLPREAKDALLTKLRVDHSGAIRELLAQLNLK